MQRAHSPSSALLLLVLLTGAALALRLSGVGHMLPCLTEPDAHVVEQVEMLRAGSPDSVVGTKAYGKYPHLLSRALLLVSPPEIPPGSFQAEDVPDRLSAVAEPYRRGRSLSALLSVLLLPATWLLARRFFGPWESLFAAALVATSLLHVNFSWQARPHAALATLTTLALLGLLRLRERPSLGSYALAGAATALAVACLHSGLLVLPAALVAHTISKREPGVRANHTLLLLPVSLIGLAVWFFYPFLFAEGRASGAELEVAGDGLQQAGHHFRWDWVDGGGFPILWNDLLGHDPVLLVLALVGGVAALASLARGRRPLDANVRGDLLVVLACALPYFLILGAFSKTYERFQLPLLPFYALLGVLALRVVATGLERLLGGSGQQPRLRAGIAIFLLALPTLAAVRLAGLNANADTARLAADWIGANIAPETERILVRPGTSLPVAMSEEGLPLVESLDQARRQPWQFFLRTHRLEGPGAWDVVTIPWRSLLASRRLQFRDSRGAQAARRLDEILSELDGHWALVERSRIDESEGFVNERLDARGECVARFGPQGVWVAEVPGETPPTRLPLGRGHQSEPLVLRALFAQHWGPAFDLLRLER